MATQSLVAITPVVLKDLGLREADLPAIQQVASRIQRGNPTSIAEFGRDVADHTSSYADALLDQVNNRDLDEAGAKLTAVVAAAQSFNVTALQGRSRIPVLGPWIDRVTLKTKRIHAEFETTRQQIERLVEEVGQTQANIDARNIALSEMFTGVRGEHRLLGIHIAAGKSRLQELRAEAEELRGAVGNDPALVQELSDLDGMIANLDKRVGDLVALQQSAMQSLPAIRIIQANNQMLVDKFHTIRETTVPTWKRQFMLALALNEQRNAVDLANTIDDTTNELLRRNAKLLHQNAVATAKANQRLVIDVETLQECQALLVQTVGDVIKIQREGVAQRANAEKAIQGMRLDLTRQITNQPAVKELH